MRSRIHFSGHFTYHKLLRFTLPSYDRGFDILETPLNGIEINGIIKVRTCNLRMANEQLCEGNGAEQFDDITMLCVKYNGPAGRETEA